MVSVFVQMGKWESHSDAASTVARSDSGTLKSDSPQLSPRSSSQGDVCEGDCPKVVVRSTFIDLDDQSMARSYRKLRRVKTDSMLALDVLEDYEPGKFSDEQAEKLSAPPSPPSPAKAEAEVRSESESERSNKSSSGVNLDQSAHTTVMLRNLPNNYTRDMFLALLDEQGLGNAYDFVYLPCDFYRDANLGYAFVNLVDQAAVQEVWRIFDGFSEWSLPSAKVCQVKWSGPHQGLKAHVDRYKNSPVMHRSVPDEYKPVIFQNGVRKPFPRPTKKVKAPMSSF
ncbi:unnamed protein product [Effrenium voratum]|uniref:Mei2-like C-terminal RNA recognition motif domain-containing protein n=1 Tax=Effrenium voratum TaxID=2562239 RepID=A0AA36N6N6_9DINO|nr:unnamed protein product [Effrenium voratum]